jgi:hypothetical protein
MIQKNLFCAVYQNSLSTDNSDVDNEEKDDSNIFDNFNTSNWRFNVMPDLEPLDFTGLSGPTHHLPATATPFEFFCLFIPTYFWALWAGYTNKKADMEAGAVKGSPRPWYVLTAAELKAWVASVMFWCTFKSLSFQNFHAGILDSTRVQRWFPSYTRWEQVKRYFKISDPENENPHDKLTKVRNLWDFFITACKANLWPSREVAVDEGMKKFKGRCSFKQYIRNKPIRWGLKIYGACCAATAYLWNAILYVGKQQEDDNNKNSNGVTTSIVLDLLGPLSGKGHHVFTDNFYTSIPLSVLLRNRGFTLTGTIRSNRKGLCKQVTITKKDERALKHRPGTTRYASIGSLCYIGWFDKRAVHILTNCLSPFDPQVTVTHWYPARNNEAGAVNGRIQRTITIPPAVVAYNAHKNKVDVFDQYRAYLKFELRCRKFWHPIFWFVMESALINAWILYQTTREKANLPIVYDHTGFRISVIIALASEWEARGCTSFDCSQSPTTLLTGTKPRVKVHLVKALPFSNARFCDDKHMQYLENIPMKEGAKTSKRQLYCVLCKDHRTVFWCRKCCAPLCRGSCFVRYHTRPCQPSDANAKKA